MENKQVQISVLEFPESVRKRKEMYLMDKTHCIYEIVDNSIDEYSAGHCKTIDIKVEDEIVTIQDDGRGIPVTPHPDSKFKGLSQAEVAFTVLHAGGKFGNETSYKTATSGLHGVGSSCVNAVSEYMNLFISTDNKKHEINFKKGIITGNLKEIETGLESTGTTIEFKLDDELWGDEKIDFKRLKKRILQLAYLNPGLEFNIELDSKEDDIKEKISYKFEEGIKAYIEKISANKEKICDIAYKSIDAEGTQVDISFVFTNSYNQEIYTFCNNVPTEQGGDHLTGFKMGFYKAIEKYALENNLIKEASEIDSEDTREGICCILSVKTLNPKFEGQGKTKIKMPEIRTPIKKAIEDFLLDYLNLDYERSKKIINKVLLAAKARLAAKKAREASRGKQDLSEGSGLPGKLSDCQSKVPEDCELFITEGE